MAGLRCPSAARARTTDEPPSPVLSAPPRLAGAKRREARIPRRHRSAEPSSSGSSRRRSHAHDLDLVDTASTRTRPDPALPFLSPTPTSVPISPPAAPISPLPRRSRGYEEVQGGGSGGEAAAPRGAARPRPPLQARPVPRPRRVLGQGPAAGRGALDPVGGGARLRPALGRRPPRRRLLDCPLHGRVEVGDREVEPRGW